MEMGSEEQARRWIENDAPNLDRSPQSADDAQMNHPLNLFDPFSWPLWLLAAAVALIIGVTFFL